MASDLIYREDAKDFVRHACHKGLNPVEYLDEIPAADVQPVVRGEWISDGDGYHWTYNCSICGWKDGYPFNERHKYCPNCGADMRKVVEIEQVKEDTE